MKIVYSVALTSLLAFGIIASGCQAKPKEQKTVQATTSASPAYDAQKPSPTPDSSKPPVTARTRLIVYYFHGHQRCPTCHKLENYAKSEIETSFADAIKNGRLEWKTVNVEVAGNEHYNTDYKLYSKSVIISTQKEGKEVSWKNLDQIWQLVHEESDYRDYIKREVKACLEEKCL